MDNFEECDALPNGIEARKEWANGRKIQFKSKRGNNRPWEDVDESKHTLDIFRHCYWFRIKPETLTINAQLPKPSRAFQQNTEVYAVTYEFKTREERNAFADKLRGTNS